jgi:hypothetical protein
MTSFYLLCLFFGLRYGGLWNQYIVNGNKIWLLRHCDMPSSLSPCCSSIGYKRNKLLGDFLSEKISEPVLVMASGYIYEKACQEVSNLTIVPHMSSLLKMSSAFGCKKTQRMYLTAYAMYYHLGDKVIGEVNTDFCVGQERQMVAFLKKHVLNNLKVDVVVVWEHNGLMDILRDFGFQISKWKNRLKEYYELVFWIDLDLGDWGYECFDFRMNGTGTGCSQSVVEWLDIREVGVGIRRMNEKDLGTRIWMIVVLGFFVGCGTGFVAFLIYREISSVSEDFSWVFRKMPIYG